MARNSFRCRYIHVVLIIHEEWRCRTAKSAQIAMFEIVERDLNVLSQQCVCCTMQKGVHKQIQLNIGPLSIVILRSGSRAAPTIILIIQICCNRICFRYQAQLRRLSQGRNFFRVIARHFAVPSANLVFVINSRSFANMMWIRQHMRWTRVVTAARKHCNRNMSSKKAAISRDHWSQQQ